MNLEDLMWIEWDDEITKKIIIDPKEAEKALKIPAICYHRWVPYVGLREVYDYCELCGVKK